MTQRAGGDSNSFVFFNDPDVHDPGLRPSDPPLPPISPLGTLDAHELLTTLVDTIRKRAGRLPVGK